MRIVQNTFIYILLISCTVGIFSWIYKDWVVEPEIPLSYSFDALFLSPIIKNMTLGDRWYLSNPDIGLPYGQNLADFPQNDTFGYGLTKILAMITQDQNITIFISYFLGFIFCSLTAYGVAVKLIKNRFLSFCIALSYNFMTYHFIHGVEHLFLSFYFTLPFAVYIYCRLLESEKISKKEWSVMLVMIFLIGINGLYYTIFSFIVFAIGLVQAATKKQAMHIAVLCIFLVLLLIAHLIPTAAYQLQNGRNPEVTFRDPYDSILLGVRLVHMFIPTHINTQVNSLLRLSAIGNQESGEYLGFLGSIAMVYLLVRFLRQKLKSNTFESRLGTMILTLFLFSTVAGAYTFISYFISPSIRAYTRISPIITFSALLLFGIYAQNYIYNISETRKYIVYVVIAMLTASSIYLQISYFQKNTDDFISIKEEYKNDKDFIGVIESKLPPNSWIMQMPYQGFPEKPMINGIGYYELFRPYLASNSLKFAFGAMSGRDSDIWQQAIDRLPPKYGLQLSALTGFDGLIVDSRGYTDPAQFINQISDITGQAPHIDAIGRLLYFPLEKTTLTPQSIHLTVNQQKDLGLNPPFIFSVMGCQGKQLINMNRSVTCDSTWMWKIYNTAHLTRHFKLDIKFSDNKHQNKVLVNVNGHPVALNEEETDADISQNIEIPPLQDARLIYSVQGVSTEVGTQIPKKYVFDVGISEEL